MSKTLIIVIGIFLIIIILISVSSWQLRKMAETLSKSGAPPEFNLQTEELEKLLQNLQGLSPSEITTKEFVSQDGKLKMNYRSDWFKIEQQTMFERMIPKERVEKYGVETLFLAQKIGKKMFAQLEVDKMILENQKSFEDVIETMKKDNQEKGWEMEILKSEKKEDEMVFEAQYKKEEQEDVYSLEKMLSYELEGKKVVYLVSFITFDSNWKEFKNEATEIIGSAGIIK